MQMVPASTFQNFMEFYFSVLDPLSLMLLFGTAISHVAQVSGSRERDILGGDYIRYHVTNIKEKLALSQKRNREWIVNAASGQPLESGPGSFNSGPSWDSVKHSVDAFYRFSRPHTVIGTVKCLFS